MQPIDPRTHMVVDVRDYSEIAGALAVDLDTGMVEIKENTYVGECRSVKAFPNGIKLVRRR